MMQSEPINDRCDSGQDANNPDARLPAPIEQPSDSDVELDDSGYGPYDWDYSRTIVLREQKGVAVYTNSFDEIVIRAQEKFIGDGDQFVFIARANLAALISALVALLPDDAPPQRRKAVRT
jgi:hypothetical protein